MIKQIKREKKQHVQMEIEERMVSLPKARQMVVMMMGATSIFAYICIFAYKNGSIKNKGCYKL